MFPTLHSFIISYMIMNHTGCCPSVKGAFVIAITVQEQYRRLYSRGCLLEMFISQRVQIHYLYRTSDR